MLTVFHILLAQIVIPIKLSPTQGTNSMVTPTVAQKGSIYLGMYIALITELLVNTN